MKTRRCIHCRSKLPLRKLQFSPYGGQHYWECRDEAACTVRDRRDALKYCRRDLGWARGHGFEGRLWCALDYINDRVPGRALRGATSHWDFNRGA